MAHYTFIAEYLGGTYIRQMEADSLQPACMYWADQTCLFKDIPNLDEAEFMEAFQDDMEEFSPTAIEDASSVWYMSFLVADEMLSVNIVKTDLTPEPVLENAEQLSWALSLS